LARKIKIEIGSKKFESKKSALDFYKKILNKYDFNESLNDEDYQYLLDLVNYDAFYEDITNNNNIEEEESQVELKDSTNENESFVLEDVKIVKGQYSTKCFQLIWDDGDEEIISYRFMINQNKLSDESIFRIACRNATYSDLRQVKQKYFDVHSVKGCVKCQETGILSKWIELQVDHRQPNTFSVITDRFIELNNINFSEIEYEVGSSNKLEFKDVELKEKFKEYHKKIAKLRVIRKECNKSRSFMGRTKTLKSDLLID